ncbi:MAG: glycine/betaine ABC transporter substrate-binding protein [Candidatus Thioglobus autotrophicus]|jgi:glycine betaine/proline transport system substrate-binding protein|nr:glycine/betaine ABC transporter substrate-binding protein [Candidatus Thioglobus autotrophicus]
MKLINKVLAVSAISLSLMPALASADCGKARLADFDWNSANVHTGIVQFILEHGYGCEVETTRGSTTPIMAAHYDSQLDIVTELWYDNIVTQYDAVEASGVIRNIGINTPDSQQAFYVDRNTADKYSIKSVLDMNNPEIAALFSDPENPDMGRMVSCIGGWTCYTINHVKQRVYGLDKFYTNFDPGSSGALAAEIAGAFAKDRPIFTYYWAPTALMGKVDLVRLVEPPYDAACWGAMMDVVEDIKANGKDVYKPTCATEYKDMSLDKSVLTAWADTHPEETAFLEAYSIPTATVNKLLAFYEGEADGDMELLAMEYLQNNSEWKSWVSAEVAAKVSGAL